MRLGTHAAILLSVWTSPVMAAQVHADVPEMVLNAVFPLDNSEGVEPSGLTFFDSELYCISDKHDTCIFRVQFEDGSAALEPAIWFELPNDGPEGLCDFEGITRGQDGEFYLVSEKMFRILRVPADGKKAQWISPDLRPAGKEAGLFRTDGAYFEGITLSDSTHFILCAERQPRGIFVLDIGLNPAATKVFTLSHATVPPRGIRVPDFTDLCFHDGALYALERNAEIISTLELDDRTVRVNPWRSFRKPVNRREWRYTDRRFGMAEGLAMRDGLIYVVLDNNQDARAGRPEDRRPLLFVFRP